MASSFQHAISRVAVGELTRSAPQAIFASASMLFLWESTGFSLGFAGLGRCKNARNSMRPTTLRRCYSLPMHYCAYSGACGDFCAAWQCLGVVFDRFYAVVTARRRFKISLGLSAGFSGRGSACRGRIATECGCTGWRFNPDYEWSRCSRDWARFGACCDNL